MGERTDTVEVRVEGRLTVERGTQIQRMLLDAFQQGEQVVIDLGGVTDVDAAGLQLLCSAHRTSIARMQGLQLKRVDEGAVGSVVAGAGFLRHAGCDVDTGRTCIWRGGF